MTYEEYKRKRQERDSAATFTSYESYKYNQKAPTAKSVLDDLNARVQNWFNNNSTFMSDYTSRFSNRTGSYDDSYVNDAKSAFEYATNQKQTFDKELQDILAIAEEYKDFLSLDYRTMLSTNMKKAQEAQNNMLKGYSADVDYWSQWKDENAYKEWVDVQKQNEEWAAVNIEGERGWYDRDMQNLAQAKEWQDKLDYDRELRLYYPNDYHNLPNTLSDADIRNANAQIIRLTLGKGIDEFEKYLSEKNVYLTQAERYQKSVELASVADAPDFEQYAQKGEAQKGKETDQNMIAYWRNRPDALEQIKLDRKFGGVINFLNSEGNMERAPDYKVFKAAAYMKDEEFKIYNYYFATDKNKAKQYLESIEGTLNVRESEPIANAAGDNGALSLILKGAAGLDQFYAGMEGAWDMLTGNDAYVPPSAIQIAASSDKVNQTLGEIDLKWFDFSEGNWKDADIFGKSLGQVAGDITQTTANQLPSIMMSFIPVVGQGLSLSSMGISASGNAYTEMINAGYSKEQAKSYGMLVGGSEVILGSLLDGTMKVAGKLTGITTDALIAKFDKALARVAISTGSRMLGEFTEESLQTILEPWFKSVVTNTEYDPADLDEILYSGLLGALSAGMLGNVDVSNPNTIAGATANAINKYKSNVALGKQISGVDGALNRLVELGSVQSADSVAYKVAEKINKRLADGKKVGAYTIAKLFNAEKAALTETNVADITRLLIEKGVTESDAKTISAWMAKAVEGVPLTEAQANALENNPLLNRTFQDVIINPNSTVYQRTKQMSDFASDVSRGEMTQNKAVTATPATDTAKAVDTTESATAEEDATESKFKASVDGKTVLTETAEEVKPVGIESIKNGSVKVKLENGKVVDASELAFATSDEAVLYGMVSKMDISPESAMALIKNFKATDGVSAERYAIDAPLAYKYGTINYAKGLENITDLTPTQRQTAYYIGQNAASAQVKAQQTAVSEKSKESSAGKQSTSKKKGSVRFEKGAYAKTREQKRAVKLAQHLAKAIGIDIVFYDATTKAKGENGYGANGYFDEKTDTIYLDIQNATDDTKTIVFTMSHELTHFIKKWSLAKFKVFADFLMDQYGDTDITLESKMEQLGTSDPDLAYEELIADACETMLLDSNAVVKLMKLRESDLDLFEKIKMHVLELVNKIRTAYKNLGREATTDEAQALLKMEGVLEKLSAMFEEAAVDAAKNYQGKSDTASETSEEGVKKQAKPSKKDPRYLDPRTVTETDVVELLNNVNLGVYDYGTHIPIRISTPSSLIYWAKKKLNDVIDNNPISMSVEKAEQAMAREGQDEAHRPHRLSVNDMIAVIKKMNAPRYIVYQGANGRYVEVIEHVTEDNRKVFAVFEIGEFKDSPYMNGYEDGVYNVLVTTFPPDAGKLQELLENPKNKVIFDKEKDSSQGTSGSTVPSVLNDKPFYEDIITQPKPVVKNQMKKTSDKDYLDAVNSGDMETAQRMVDEAAREAGYDYHLYHGTNADFTVFDLKKHGGKNGKGEGYGIYLAANKEISAPYGKNVIDSYTKFNRLAEGNKKTLTYAEVKKIVEKSCELEAKKSVEDGEYDSITDAIRDTWVSNYVYTYDYASMSKVFSDVANILWKNNDNDGELINEVMASSGAHYDYVNALNFYETVLTPTTGIDGFHYIWGNKDGSGVQNDIYLAFSSEQIKSAEPVTYDKNGNVIPLSERFNSNNPDIRFQMKKSSNRAILTEALKGVAQNDIEKNKLAQYKAKIDLLIAEEQKLQGLRAEIKELSFAKGPRDTKQINSLQFMANQTANRINTYDKQLLSLEATTALKNVLEREKARVRKAEAERGKEALKAYREKAETELRDTVLRYQESRHKAVEGRRKTEERHAIAKIAKDLDKLLNRGTKERNVKKGASDLVRSALDLANMYFASDDDIITSGIATQMTDAETKLIEKYTALYDEYHSYDDSVTANKVKRAELRSKMNAIRSELSDVLEREKKRINDTTASGIYDTLIKEYKKLSGAEESYLREAFDQDVVEYIEEMRKKVGNNLIGDMTLEQLKDLHRAFTMIKTVVQKSNKLFGEKNRATIAEQGESAIAEIEKQGHKATFSHTGKLASTMSFNNLKPIYLIERTKSKVLQERMQEILDGESIWAVDMEEGRAFMDEAKKKHGYDKWDFDKAYEFETETGLKYSLTLGEIFSIYAYSKRGEQALNHLRVDGFVFDKTKKIKNGKELNDSTSYAIDDKTRLSILGKLTAEQRAFIDETQKYLSEVMGEKGNEVSREMYGIDLFGEENYFPLRAEGAYLERAREQANGQVKYKNRGFTKATQEGAHNPVMLSDYSKVWAEHVAEMSGYHAFTLALENFYKVYNYQNKSSTETNKKGVIPALNNAYGDGITKAIDQLLIDLNGGARSDPRESPFKTGLSLFKKAKTMFSLSVIIQQPSSLLRAQAMIDAKYFVGFSKGKHKDLWNEIKKYAPVAVIKEMGRFDVGMGRSSAEWLLNDKNWREIVDDFLSKGASYADEVAWIKIWNAVKRETLHTEPTLKPNSEEFLKKAGQRFEDIIRHTQVYDSTLSRSGNMRSKSGLMQIVTAFLAEPTTAINMREMALRSGDKNRIIRTTVAVYASTLLNAVLVALPYAMRDDDEDETFIEKYATALTTSFVDSINPLTSLPFIKDIYSMLQGYDVKRSDMALADDLINSFEKFISSVMDEEKDKDKITSSLLSLVGDLSSFTGLPVDNAIREVKSIVNFAKTLTKDFSDRDTTWLSLADNLQNAFTKETPIVNWFFDEETKTDKLYDAIMAGDMVYAERIKGTYKTEASLETAMRKALREHDSRIKEAAEARIRGDIAEYARIVREITSEGKFVQDIVVGAVNAEINAINKAASENKAPQTEEKVEEATSIYKADDINAALENGDMALAKEIITELISVKSSNSFNKAKAEAEKEGKKFNEKDELEEAEKSAKSSIKSSITKHWKPIVREALESNDRTELLRIRDLLFDTGLYGRSRSEVYNTMKEWREDD